MKMKRGWQSEQVRLALAPFTNLRMQRGWLIRLALAVSKLCTLCTGARLCYSTSLGSAGAHRRQEVKSFILIMVSEA
jgi:hypothetical protein